MSNADIKALQIHPAMTVIELLAQVLQGFNATGGNHAEIPMEGTNHGQPCLLVIEISMRPLARPASNVLPEPERMQ